MSADVLLLPSRAEFTPHVINEAYAFGLPVIASSVGAIPEMIEDGVTGYVVRSGEDPNEYSDRMERLLRDPKLLSRMRPTVRERFDREMSQEAASRRLNRLLEHVVSRQV